MATSGKYTYSNSRNDIIEQAYRYIGVLGTGQLPSAEQYDEAGKILNTMIKSWRGQGVLIQTLDWISLSLRQSSYVTGTDGNVYECIRNHTASTDNCPITGGNYLSFWRLSIDAAAVPTVWTDTTAYVSICNYDLDPSITAIHKGFYRQGPTVGSPTPFDRTLQITTESEYFELGGKTTGGKSVLCYFKRAAIPQIFLFPYPLLEDVGAITVNLSVMRFPQDILDPTDNTDFLPEWEESIIYGLAWRMCMSYGIEGNIATMIKAQAQESLIMARGMDEDNTNLQIQLNLRGTY